MKIKTAFHWTYKVLRSILFSASIFVIFLFTALYITLSIPPIQRHIKTTAETELSKFLGARLEIAGISIMPFNEVILTNVRLYTPDGQQCVAIGKVGAGISIKHLLQGEIVVTYAELLGLDAKVWKSDKDAPLNIQFLIDAFAPKDKNKPPAKFKLAIRNIVIRKSSASYDLRYMPAGEPDKIDFHHLKIADLAADVTIPLLSDQGVDVDLRRLTFTIAPGLKVNKISGHIATTPTSLAISDLSIETPQSKLTINDQEWSMGNGQSLLTSILSATSIVLADCHITPSDFASLYPPLKRLQKRIYLEGSIDIDATALKISNLNIYEKEENGLYMSLNADISDIDFPDIVEQHAIAKPKISLKISNSKIPQQFISTLLNILPSSSSQFSKYADVVGNIALDVEANGDLAKRELNADAILECRLGILKLKGEIEEGTHYIRSEVSIEGENIKLADVFPQYGVDDVNLSLKAEGNVHKNILTGRHDIYSLITAIPQADINIEIPSIAYKGNILHDITAIAQISNGKYFTQLHSPDYPLHIDFESQGVIEREMSQLTAQLSATDFKPSLFIANPNLTDASINGDIFFSAMGSNLDNLEATLRMADISYHTPGKDLTLNRLDASTDINPDGERITEIHSEWLDGDIRTDIPLSAIYPSLMAMLSEVSPKLIPTPSDSNVAEQGSLKLNLTLRRDAPWQMLGNLPYLPLYNITIAGEADLMEKQMRIAVDAPYLQQGRDKLVQETRFAAMVKEGKAFADFHTILPTKKGDLDLNAHILAHDETAELSLDFNPGSDGKFYGNLLLDGHYQPAIKATGSEISVNIRPSKLYLNHAEWDVGEATLRYADKQAEIHGFSVAHDHQFITINGTASTSPDDRIVVSLSDVDLDYIFDTLNINYVSFGGNATGEAIAAGVFSPSPDIRTTHLYVKDFAYNHSILGDGRLHGDFDLKTKRIGIGASVAESGRHVADIEGGIWLGRDSLAFDIDADKVRIGFLQKFMQAFSPQVSGRASGKGLLYGTFKDVNMTGRFFADTIAVKIGYTNVTYGGSDSVIMTPGRISIPSFTLYDAYGHPAKLTGQLTHRYFHDPYFNFKVSDAKGMLLYDTDAKMNNRWYGKIFGSGGGVIDGTPEMVSIVADMTTEGKSDFTFVLDNSLEAADYNFLTFTDRRKLLHEMVTADEDSPDEIVKSFRKKVQAQQAAESAGFEMDIRATITPAAKITLVMDPASGDKITAYGSGPINITYADKEDEFRMIGKYTLEEGKYNFSLQDIILKDFIIRRGSSVSFNGDPMNALLDIQAAYRVNTNLTDLDKSFATDRDLNRTNVPVDAMLIVQGEMTHPDIAFDIALPTLNEEVERKVRSIISSEDMMNMQMIYLLALNRFYTPEYMGGQSSGAEWTSLASTTVSSQLQNVLGKLTDKVTVAPSFRSDKGDFSDFEMDVALSSRLLNNRLLLNGNFGYRDPSTSTTTFIGDFDVEYLLTRNGNWRLKAYNHFNDQNYYLKSALTTQGVGVIFRKEFDYPATIKKKKATKTKKVKKK